MSVRTNIARGYLVRLGLVAVFTVGFALWFLYDGVVAWPNQRERGLKFQELVDQGLTEQEVYDQWEVISSERGWPRENSGKPKTEHAIYGQYILAGAVAPIGLIFLYLVLSNKGRWIEATEEGLQTSWKQSLGYDQILTLDKKQWKKKGIAKIRYEDDNRNRKLVLDDCKYDFKPTAEILRLVESRIDVDQIINGPPESIEGEETEEDYDQPVEQEGDTEVADQDAEQETAQAESDVKDEAV